MSSTATIVNDNENGDCVQQPSSNTSGVPSNTTTTQVIVAPSNATTTQASKTHQGNKKRSRGSTSLARADGQPSSSGANANPLRSRRTTARRFVEDDMPTADRAISDSPLVRGTSDVPLPPTGRRQESRSRSRRNTNEGPGSSSERADGEPGISLETAAREPGSGDASFTEDDLTLAERTISGTPLLRNLGKHPSVYAREGRNPPTQGLSYRGAWKKAVKLYRVANDQYKQLFVAAGFADFLKIEPVELPQGYLIALTERWFAETNSLHLPCGEIGPTPVDWTMITGLQFKGRHIKLSPQYEKRRALELLGIEDIRGGKIPMRYIEPDEDEVKADPPTIEAKERIFRRLFLYVISVCFFGNNHSVIHYELVQFLENVNEVGRYNWGAITYAAFLAGMRRKVTAGQIGSFTAFWQFLLYWAFEYLNIYRPENIEEDVDVFPRAMRWKFPYNLGSLDNSELTASRCQLDYVDHVSKVTWQPYLDNEMYGLGGIQSSIALAKKRVPFMSLETWEYYLGERCRQQLGLPRLVPSDPPGNMHGEGKDKPEDRINVGISAEALVKNEEEDYASWFADNSIGKIVDVTRLIGGTDIGKKVIGDWMAKHQPDMIFVPKSEVKEITEARDAAEAKREKLREKLSGVRRSSDS